MAQQPTVRPRMKVLFQPLSILLIAGFGGLFAAARRA